MFNQLPQPHEKQANYCHVVNEYSRLNPLKNQPLKYPGEQELVKYSTPATGTMKSEGVQQQVSTWVVRAGWD